LRSLILTFFFLQDQLRSLPPRVPAATLSGSVSAAATAAILDDVIRKRIKVLFVSPERLASPSFRRLFRLTWNPDTKQKERKFPEISLLCIDEAHCASQWAHNFRPCFLRFKNLLRLMSPRSILAITATAGPRVIADISETLGIQPTEATDENDPNGWVENNESIKVIKKGRDNIDVSCRFLANHEERLSMVRSCLAEIRRWWRWLGSSLTSDFFPAYEDSETSNNANSRREEMRLFGISCGWRCDRIRVATERYGSRRRVSEFIRCEWRSCDIPWRYGYECSQQSSEQGTTKIVGLCCFDLIL
jgi:hypothetical protein